MSALLDRLRRWYRLNVGVGRAMRAAGATVRPCPRCARRTPVYETRYGDGGEPTSFSVCLCCGAHVEYDAEADELHEAYERPSRERVR